MRTRPPNHVLVEVPAPAVLSVRSGKRDTQPSAEFAAGDPQLLGERLGCHPIIVARKRTFATKRDVGEGGACFRQ